jgi:hypothetical protein
MKSKQEHKMNLLYSTAPLIQMDAIEEAATYSPRNSAESNAQQITLEQLMRMHNARQRRIAANQGGVSWFEWLVLLIGAGAIIGFCWLFGMRNPRTHFLMTSAVVTVIVSIPRTAAARQAFETRDVRG